MMASSERYLTAVAATAVLALGLYGCGGGGGDGPETGGSMPSDEMTEYGHGLNASTLASPTASSASDSLESMAGTAFATVSAPVLRDPDGMGNQSVALPEDDDEVYVKSITSDGAGGQNVVYVVNGDETEVLFQASDLTDRGYFREMGGIEYWLYQWHIYSDDTQQPIERHYFSLVGWDAGEWRGKSAFGVLSPSDSLATLGSATYEGHISAELHSDFTSGNWRDTLQYLWGEMTLQADFSAGTVHGAVGREDGDELWIQRSDRSWMELTETNSIAISDGEIDENRFHAEWEGQDTDANSALDDSMRGFEGSMLGEFYGPNGEEVGGVLTGERAANNQVINGVFGAAKQDETQQ